MPIGCSEASLLRRLPAGVVGREPALLHRGRGQGGEADHVADGVDVRYLGLERRPHPDPAAVVRGQPRLVQGRGRRWRPAGRRST